ncbi:hypothetical protein ABN034_27325 [Actinopolymorpha sp. B11F2]|uniref:hypothetical protein n=1 Tax=Actinopolymorpha sp. B11F2 TaxID=3160862 RepID=UPI0032E3E40E
MQRSGIRTFQTFRWKDMPGAALPTDAGNGAPWYSDEELNPVRLSSKSHWDLPIRIGKRHGNSPAHHGHHTTTVHFPASDSPSRAVASSGRRPPIRCRG